MVDRERTLALLDAPSNLGLRPPAEGLVPGCYKAPGVLRDAGLLDRLGAVEAGVVTAGRYRPDWTPGVVRNEAAIAAHSRRLANRVQALLHRHNLPVVLGGDCSILVGIGLALRRVGRFGLVSLDGLDYRHPGNMPDRVGAMGGESLAVVTGLGGALAELDGLRPYLRSADTVAMGIRPDDECADEAAGNGLHLVDAIEVSNDPAAAAARALDVVERADLDGFWIHVDADVLDPELMPAVDAPDPGGLTFDQLTTVLRVLLGSPGVVGIDLTIYDPDLDPDLSGGRRLADLLADVLAGTGQ
ncbi:arginase family protein [Phytoactinopolyspora halotolerans]|uniref:Arginase family protein n=1 Tax=Phytoactinopolyspora halotolerans TaxID=1981512 RepID=A0A6L9SH95_9ACTN|nr:arginase family protein [Phytoactinopolyspora halotolerans]NEE04497.1 arginase family protein [Phytoactinopolyspora halotolerans]